MSPKMVELHDIDVPAFLKVLDSCEGNVYLMTRDGDRLNLKSKLCQLVGLTALIEGGRLPRPLSCVRARRTNPSCSGSISTSTQERKSKGPALTGE